MRKKKYMFEKMLDAIKCDGIVMRESSKLKKRENMFAHILKEYRGSVWSLSVALLLLLLLVFTNTYDKMAVSSDNSYLSTEISVQINVIIDDGEINNVTE